MKRFVLAFLCVLAALLFLAPLTLAEEEAIFRLPISLRIIEEEAFMGTMPESIETPETLKRIEKRAFADIESLSRILMSVHIEFISDDTFEGSGTPTLYGKPGSYAHDWAKAHGFRFLPSALWVKDDGQSAARKGINQAKHALKWQLKEFICLKPGSNRDGFITMRPQDRAELHPIDYRFP